MTNEQLSNDAETQSTRVALLYVNGKPQLRIFEFNGSHTMYRVYDLSMIQTLKLAHEAMKILWDHSEVTMINMDKRNMPNYCAED